MEREESAPIEPSAPPMVNPVSEGLGDPMVFEAVKPRLDKFFAPSRKRIQKLDEKIARKNLLLKNLGKHKEDGTLPKTVLVPRMPLIPESLKDKFTDEYKSMSEKFAKDTLEFLFKVRTEEIDVLRNEREQLLKDAMEKVKVVCGGTLTQNGNISEDQMISVFADYETKIREEMTITRLETELDVRVGQAIEEEKKHASLLKKTAAEADEAEPSTEVDRLRKEVQALRKDMIKFKKTQPQPKNNTKSGNVQGKKPKKNKPNKNNGKQKPKNGSHGAAGRGAKQN